MWNTERAMALFQQHQSMSEFQSADVASYYDAFKTSSDAEPLRQFIRTTFGDAWTQQIHGF